MKLRMRDIAQRAGVSPATVSNALNGRGGVSKAVQEQIMTIAREMGYQPSRESRRIGQHVRLIMYKSHGMVVGDTAFFAELTESIQLECRRVGLELLISHLHAREDADCAEQIRFFAAEECAGIILLGTEMSPEELHQFDHFHSPLVVLDSLFRYENVHSVVINNMQAGYLAAQALCEAGHRHIGHITSSISFNNMNDRLAGFRDGLARFGLTLPEEQLWPVRPSIPGAYEDMKQLIAQRGSLPEAFFAGNDLMAVGCMRAITEAGYRIPEDVSIIGMDDTSVCLACTPQLSTIHVYKKEMGFYVVQTLMSLKGNDSPYAIKAEIGVSVVMRDSIRRRDPAAP
ncbi:MAG: LacI family DNA-binding transcriptional regulator [Aristaeellaceae bacterium]